MRSSTWAAHLWALRQVNLVLPVVNMALLEVANTPPTKDMALRAKIMARRKDSLNTSNRITEAQHQLVVADIKLSQVLDINNSSMADTVSRRRATRFSV